MKISSDDVSETISTKRKKNGYLKIKKYFKEYCDSTSIHGFRYLAEPRSTEERILWILLIALSLFACGFLIRQIYGKYNESPVLVSFATKESPIYTIPFPAVTICPMTKIQTSLFNYPNVLRKLDTNISLTDKERLYAKYMTAICDVHYNQISNETHFTEDFYKAIDEIKIPIDSFMEYCMFMGTEAPCSDIFVPIIIDESICFSFNILDRSDIFNPNVIHFSNYHKNNSTKWNIENGYGSQKEISYFPYRAFLAGADNSLEILLYQNFSDVDHVCRIVPGYRVALHAPYAIPQLKKQYFFVPFDRVVNAIVLPKVMTTSEKVKRYKPGTRQCFFSTEQKLKYFKIYSPKNCNLECLTNISLKHCGCVKFYMPREKDTPICGNAKSTCLKEAELNLNLEQYEIQIDDQGNDFFCDCKPLCTDMTYEVEQSQAPFNFKQTFKEMGHEKSFDDRIHYAKLLVFFKQDSFLTSERNELYGPTDFLANFGGLLGLFTGFSLLSAAEILYFLSIRLLCNFRLFQHWTGPEE